MSFSVFTLAERPDLEEEARSLDSGAMPEFMHHDAVVNRFWGKLYSGIPEFQFAIVENSGEVVATGNTIPLSWDAGNLPGAGLDAALEHGFEDLEAGRSPTVLSALLAIVGEGDQRRGLSRGILKGMKDVAGRHGFDALIAPVRPTMKSVYPLTPMERYIGWRRDDGFLFDPWMRVHERLGAKVVRVAPESMKITGSVAEWEEWAKMRFPESGEYVVEGALCPVEMDIENDLGTYVEPNVWMKHTV